MENFKIGKLTIFILISALAFILNPEISYNILQAVFLAFRPIFISLAIAFVINRPICKIYILLSKINFSNLLSPKNIFSTAKIPNVSCGKRLDGRWIFSVILGYFFLLSFIFGLILIIIPEVEVSIEKISYNFEEYRLRFLEYYRLLLARDKFGIFQYIFKLAENIPSFFSTIYTKTASIFTVFTDIIIGTIISIYILIDKDRISALAQKFFRRICSENFYNKISNYYFISYDVLSKFIVGQITEAFILGILCFFGMVIFRFDYAFLISVIIAVTALLPVVGAFVGTIPSALLLFLEEPISAVWFVIFIIVLQQLENNLIYPKIVGKSIGLPPLAVLIAILLGAKFFGAFGILLFVPIFAVIFEIAKSNSEKSSNL